MNTPYIRADGTESTAILFDSEPIDGNRDGVDRYTGIPVTLAPSPDPEAPFVEADHGDRTAIAIVRRMLDEEESDSLGFESVRQHLATRIVEGLRREGLIAPDLWVYGITATPGHEGDFAKAVEDMTEEAAMAAVPTLVRAGVAAHVRARPEIREEAADG